ncbi:hypothetical protein IM697_18490 [Streptomyces ferrugineus]|uniref:Uncharacterized protein n=1 Tax=Streptomyces ferrugineus TaxID=1413221 RepID=A0A7M2SY55_9ACTN|nr:hypothetical protein [Streptomyces ferrugineus]QOV40211.1 hypothetical protein IM697_18490 [Streptomyces ferrugineus]
MVRTENHRNDEQRPWWRRVRVACVITGAVMTATYWTLRVIEAAIQLHQAASPWS